MKLFLCLLFVACASAAPSSRIVGGDDAVITDFPWQVSLQLAGSHFCGGSLIGTTYVLSAAHCVQNVLQGVRVGYGSTNYKQSTLVEMTDWIQHPLWEDESVEKFDYDYSVATLSSVITMDETVQAISVPSDDSDYLTGDLLTSGWGVTSKPAGTVPETLQYAVVPYMEHDACVTAMAGTTITSRMICAGAQGSTSCSGDSGGPLVKQVGDFTSGNTASNYVLLGAVSFGYAACPQYEPAVYARVSQVHTWIDSNTQ